MKSLEEFPNPNTIYALIQERLVRMALKRASNQEIEQAFNLEMVQAGELERQRAIK